MQVFILFISLGFVGLLGYLGNVVGDYFVDHNGDAKKIKAAKATGTVIGLLAGFVIVSLVYLLHHAWQDNQSDVSNSNTVSRSSPTPSATISRSSPTPSATISRSSPAPSRFLSNVQQKELDNLYRASRSR